MRHAANRWNEKIVQAQGRGDRRDYGGGSRTVRTRQHDAEQQENGRDGGIAMEKIKANERDDERFGGGSHGS